MNDPACFLLHALLVEVRALRSAIERRGQPHVDADDRALVSAIAAQVGSAAFSAAELVEHATLVPALGAAIIGTCGSLSARRVGKALKRIEGKVFDGAMIVRVGQDRDGAIWKCEFREFDTRTPVAAS